jgi:hypothetical protein
LKHERATEEIRELAALYALGSLTQHEAHSFEIHMHEGCAVCEGEFRRFARTIGEMGFASEEVPAPDYIRDLLLARIERERQSAAPQVAQKYGKGLETPHEKAAPTVPLMITQPQREGPHILPWILATALVVLAIASYFVWKSSQDTNNQLQALLSAARMDAEELQKNIGSQKGRSRELEQIAAIANKPEARIARLIGQAATPSYAGAIFWDTQQNQCLVLGSFLPTPQGKVYQLWFFSATAKLPIGLLRTDSNGRVFMTLPVPKDTAGSTAVVVTLEPDNGSQIPTSPYCVAGRID